jgi:hypothetical protein
MAKRMEMGALRISQIRIRSRNAHFSPNFQRFNRQLRENL